MENERPSGFKFSVDDDERPDSLFQSRRESPRREFAESGGSMGAKVAILFFLMICLVAAAFFAAYIYVEGKFEKIHSSGSAEVQTLSKDFESKLTSLTAQYAKLEEDLGKKISAGDEIFSKIEKSAASLRETLKKAEKSLDELRASKADKKDMEGVESQIERALSPFRKEMSDMKANDARSAVDALDKKFTENLAQVSDTVSKTKESVDKLRGEFSGSSSGKITKETLDIALKNQKEAYEEKLSLMYENFKNDTDKVKALQKKTEELEGLIRSLRTQQRRTSGYPSTTPSTKPVKPMESNPRKPSSRHPIDEISPGGSDEDILEQDIQQ